MNDEIFRDIVGQEKPKLELGFYLDAYRITRQIPNLLISAGKGQGKTTIARAIAKGLVQFDADGNTIEVPNEKGEGAHAKRKAFIEINCSTLRNVKQFVNGILIPYVQDKDVTLLFDEASEIPRDITMALLTILNPSPTNQTSFAMDEYVCDFDFRRQTFLFATSEIQKVFHALVDRLERITLEEYSMPDLAAIVQKGVPAVEFREDVLLDVATVLRGNARAAQKMAGKLTSYLGGRHVFDRGDWSQLCKVLSIYPLGLNALEIQILRFLAQNINGTSLTALSAKTGMSRDSLQKDTELYLQRHSLLEITTGGRVITAKGLQYLKDLDKT